MNSARRGTQYVVAAVLGVFLVVGGLRLRIAYRARPFTILAMTYLDAAIAGDTSRLAAMSNDSIPIVWATSVRRAEPQLLRAARQTLRLSWADVSRDTAIVEYAIRYPACSRFHGLDHLQFVFTHERSAWRVMHVGVPPC